MKFELLLWDNPDNTAQVLDFGTYKGFSRFYVAIGLANPVEHHNWNTTFESELSPSCL